MKLVVLLRRLRGGDAVLGACDAAALATAAWLRHAVPGATLTAIAAGPTEDDDEALALALACGADRAARVTDPILGSVDYHGVAAVLAAATRHLCEPGPDLVLCGERSSDEVQGAVGPAVAEKLGLVQLTGVTDVRPAPPGPGLLVTRELDGHVLTVRATPPLLCTIARSPHATRPMSGKAPTPSTLELETLGLSAAELRHRQATLGAAVPLRPTRDVILLADPDALLKRLREELLA